MDVVPAEVILDRCGPVLRSVAEDLREIVGLAVPDAVERVRPGWGVIGYDVPIGRRTRFFCWIWPEAQHVHLGFVQGVLMRDTERVLHGAGVTKLARWLTFEPGDRPEVAVLEPLLREAASAALLPRAAREAMLGS